MTAINLPSALRIAIVIGAAAVTPASAQRVLDLPVRTGVGGDALAGGPVAIFWNAGSIGLPVAHGEAVILDARGPAPTGLVGLAVAGSYRLNAVTALAIGFQHTGIDDIERTTTSPLPDGGATPLDLSENTFTVAGVRRAGVRSTIGAAVRYSRVSEVAGGDDVAAVGAGFRHRFVARAGFRPAIAAGAFVDGDGMDWAAGASIDGAPRGLGGWTLGGEYGVRGSPRFDGVEHRIAATGAWADQIRLGVGIAIEPGADGRTIEPAGAVSIAIDRYVVGIVREQLPNDLGAVHQFRLSVAF